MKETWIPMVVGDQVGSFLFFLSPDSQWEWSCGMMNHPDSHLKKPSPPGNWWPRRSGGGAFFFWGGVPEVFAIFVGSFWKYGKNRNSEGFCSAQFFGVGIFLWVLRTPQLRRKMWLKYLSSWILAFAKKRTCLFSRRRIENGESFGGSLVKVGKNVRFLDFIEFGPNRI